MPPGLACFADKICNTKYQDTPCGSSNVSVKLCLTSLELLNHQIIGLSVWFLFHQFLFVPGPRLIQPPTHVLSASRCIKRECRWAGASSVMQYKTLKRKMPSPAKQQPLSTSQLSCQEFFPFIYLHCSTLFH